VAAISAKIPSAVTSQGIKAKTLCPNILPVRYLESIISGHTWVCGPDNLLRINILGNFKRKKMSSYEAPKSLLINILSIKYLESISCEPIGDISALNRRIFNNLGQRRPHPARRLDDYRTSVAYRRTWTVRPPAQSRTGNRNLRPQWFPHARRLKEVPRQGVARLHHHAASCP